MPPPATSLSDESVTDALRGVIDPELHDNIVDLGMVRGWGWMDDGRLEVRIALTTAGCPLRAQLMNDVKTSLSGLPGVGDVKVTFGEMTAEQKRSLMERARWKARQEVPNDIPRSAHVIALASGKGGVGKSSVTANLAVALAARGLSVGVLDADIGGFSIPRMLGVVGRVKAEQGEGGKAWILPIEQPVGSGRLKVVSMGLVEGAGEDEAVMLRGLMLNRALQHFLEQVRWGEVDYLLLDMPPGTSDIQMGLARMLPRTEMVIVTTPAVAAQKVAARAADMARKGYLRIAGVIENMSTFTCEHGGRYELFGSGGGARLATDIGVPLLGSVPLAPEVAAGGDAGRPVALDARGPVGAAFAAIAERLVVDAVPVAELAGCTARLLDEVEAALGPAGT